MCMSIGCDCDLQGLVFEQFTINMLNLMRSILRCEAYTPAKTLEGQSYFLFQLLFNF